jgi:hypothetical protein
MNPMEVVPLDALDLLVVVDNESDTLSSVDEGVPQVPELGRLVTRLPKRATPDGHVCYHLAGEAMAREGGARACVCAGRLWAERRRHAVRSARHVSDSIAPARSCRA